jgi:ubiquinone/menaquinone biosynthesis C-methylase UbiE
VFLRFIVITVYKAIVIGRINNRQLYIKMEGKRWYPQYRMKEDYIILTDNKLIEMSNKFKFIERAEFLKLTLINDSQKPYQDNLECTKQAYNNYATIIDQINSAPWKAYERDIFLKHLQKENRTSLLEIGAGTGKDSLFFQQKGLKVTAIDFSEEMVRLCKEKGLSDVHCIDVREMDFPSNYFDAIYTLNCLFHIPKIEMISVLRQIRRIMRPDGLLYFGVIGGQNSEKIWKKDTFEPQRFFHSIVTKISRN